MREQCRHSQLRVARQHPEDGLNVSLFTGPTPGLYYVLLDPDFERCVGPRRRILDGWFFYAVTPQGEVVAESPGPPDEGTPVEPPQAPPPNGFQINLTRRDRTVAAVLAILGDVERIVEEGAAEVECRGSPQ